MFVYWYTLQLRKPLFLWSLGTKLDAQEPAVVKVLLLIGPSFCIFQRAAMRYIPETVGWTTMGVILTVAAMSVATAMFLTKRT